jgi:hypothetical protein
MTIPKIIDDYLIIYYGFWNTFIAIHNHNISSDNKIENILCVGLGLGVGGVEPKIMVELFKLAIDNYILFLKLKKSKILELNTYYIFDWDYANNHYNKIHKIIKNIIKKKSNDSDLYDLMNSRRYNLDM